MTKQEYQKAMSNLDVRFPQDKAWPAEEYIAAECKIKEEYITSIEAENARLIRVNANSVSAMELDICRSLNESLRQREKRIKNNYAKLIKTKKIMERKFIQAACGHNLSIQREAVLKASNKRLEKALLLSVKYIRKSRKYKIPTCLKTCNYPDKPNCYQCWIDYFMKKAEVKND